MEEDFSIKRWLPSEPAFVSDLDICQLAVLLKYDLKSRHLCKRQKTVKYKRHPIYCCLKAFSAIKLYLGTYGLSEDCFKNACISKIEIYNL